MSWKAYSKSVFKHTLSLIFCLTFPLCGEESLQLSEKITSRETISELNITKLRLQNGMHVIIKPINDETDEVLIRLMAKGGFTLLQPNQRASAEIASMAALESGIGELTPDQLSVLLYDNSIDFFTEVAPYSRLIEGTSEKISFQELLHLIYRFFTQSHFSKKGFEATLKEMRESLQKTPLDRDMSFEDIFNAVNTEGKAPLKALDLKTLENSNFDTSNQFFKQYFLQPQDFYCIIVGDFDLNQALSYVERYLAAIPAVKPSPETPPIPQTSFPSQITRRAVTAKDRKDSLVRLTFPLTLKITDQNKPTIDFMVQLFENHLRHVFSQTSITFQGIDVSYMLPLYPYLGSPWFIFQYHCDPQKIDNIKETILQEIANLKEKVITKKSFAEALSLFKREDAYWSRDNNYWLDTLSNDAVWEWNTLSVLEAYKKLDELTPLQIQELIKRSLSSNVYTLVYTLP